MKGDWVTGDNEEPELLELPTALSNGDGNGDGSSWLNSPGDCVKRADGYGDSDDGDGTGDGRGQY